MNLPRLLLFVVVAVACTGEPTPVPTEAPTPEPTRLNDPVSMPLEPSFALEDVETAASCGGCHAREYEEWGQSMHAHAMEDPLFQALVGIRQVDLDTKEDRFCVQCHSVAGVRSGALIEGFSFEGQPERVMEGITCVTCHQATEVVRPYNAGSVVDPSAPVAGSTSSNIVHPVEPSALLSDAALCGSCHDVIETNGIPLERPYAEWSVSPSAEAGQTCQDCHMPERAGGGREHRWLGVGTPLGAGLAPDVRAARDADIVALLQGSADLEIDVTDLVVGGRANVLVTVHNRIDGHAFPTGTTFIRQVWVELVARVDGEVVFETGTLDANGDLRDAWSDLAPYSDADLMTLGSSFTDGTGAPTLFSWQAADHTSRAISPGYARTFTLFVPVPQDAGELTLEARLRFRPIPPHLLRKTGLEDLIPEVPTYDVDQASWVQVLGSAP